MTCEVLSILYSKTFRHSNNLMMMTVSCIYTGEIVLVITIAYDAQNRPGNNRPSCDMPKQV